MSWWGLVLVTVAALACPVHMWWMNRRGRRAACCPERVDAPTDLAALRRRREEIQARLVEIDSGPTGNAQATPASTRG